MKLSVLDAQNKYCDRFMLVSLGETHNEKWLQERLFENPDMLPLREMRADTERMIPICRELPLSSPSGTVFLDLFCVSNAGRPMLIECKLWRNPQARREVVAQILEYAALLRRMSYADLTARLKDKLDWTGQNPLFDHYVRHGGTLDEAPFSDAFAQNLRAGDFQLIIAGDGIREDMRAIGELLRDQGASLALVEFQLWKNAAGHTLVVPSVPFRSEVLRQRIVVDQDNVPVQLYDTDESDDSAPNAANPERTAIRVSNRVFWQSFIDRVEFDHPDQPKPRHGSNNWVRIPLPSPAKWITAFKTQDSHLGLFLVKETHSDLFSQLAAEETDIRRETELPDLRINRDVSGAPAECFAIDVPLDNFSSEDAQISWLCDASNQMVNALRPRLARMAGD